MQIINDLGQKNRSGVLIFEEHVRRSLLRPGKVERAAGLLGPDLALHQVSPGHCTIAAGSWGELVDAPARKKHLMVPNRP